MEIMTTINSSGHSVPVTVVNGHPQVYNVDGREYGIEVMRGETGNVQMLRCPYLKEGDLRV